MDPVPALGADSLTIARELGVSDDEIDDLVAAGVLGTHDSDQVRSTHAHDTSTVQGGPR